MGPSKKFFKRIFALALSAALSGALLPGGQNLFAQERPRPQVVQTSQGKIRGLFVGGVYRFLGVPYASAKERFVPPVQAAPWNGVRDATKHGAICPQGTLFGAGRNVAGWGKSNDCLNLNIWTGAVNPDGGAPGQKKRAVMVWLHGGGFSIGSANSAMFDGSNLARLYDVVVVGVNHRLNVFGHLDLSAFGKKYRHSANVGILDIEAALRWVQQNIETFGGDPGNVTIFGESGGGAKVLALMAAPSAKGLFHKAINESGAAEKMGVEFTPQELSRELGRRTAELLGLDENNIEEIQKIGLLKIMAAGDKARAALANERKISFVDGEGYCLDWQPVVDGDFLPSSPVTQNAFAASAADVPLIVGSNLNEWSAWRECFSHPNMTQEQIDEYALAYPEKDKESAPLVDTFFRLALLKVAASKSGQKGANVYMYVFAKGVPKYGAFHTAEIPFVFANCGDPLSAVMSQAWTNFAKTGVPFADGLPEWEPYSRQGGATMIFDDQCRLARRHDERLMKMLVPGCSW